MGDEILKTRFWKTKLLLKKVYWDLDRKGIWSKGYFVLRVVINEEVIRKYVESQVEEGTG